MGMKVNGTTGLTFPDTTTLASAGQASVRAWVNFNGTGTVAIRASYNVTSITDNGTGDYTLNFTTALPDANYSVTAGVGSYTTANSARAIAISSATAPTASAVRVINMNAPAVAEDPVVVSVAIFR
jgi:hypothetical protein